LKHIGDVGNALLLKFKIAVDAILDFYKKTVAISLLIVNSRWLTHLAATLEVMGSRPSFGDISEIYFLESIISGKEGP